MKLPVMHRERDAIGVGKCYNYSRNKGSSRTSVMISFVFFSRHK